LLHGDTLCTLDTDYQAFRQQVRNPYWQTQFLAYPLSQRRLLAQQARTQSQAYTRTSALDILEVTPTAVIDALTTHSVYRLIHGHTHRPAIHQLSVNGQLAYRYVVSDWFQDEVKIMSCIPNACQLIPLELLPLYLL
ncbi:MAG: UDP-2,3-diacylglucosamine diphosphatase, partial [Beggiatoa sp. IS2]